MIIIYDNWYYYDTNDNESDYHKYYDNDYNHYYNYYDTFIM